MAKIFPNESEGISGIVSKISQPIPMVGLTLVDDERNVIGEVFIPNADFVRLSPEIELENRIKVAAGGAVESVTKPVTTVE